MAEITVLHDNFCEEHWNGANAGSQANVTGYQCSPYKGQTIPATSDPTILSTILSIFLPGTTIDLPDVYSGGSYPICTANYREVANVSSQIDSSGINPVQSECLNYKGLLYDGRPEHATAINSNPITVLQNLYDTIKTEITTRCTHKKYKYQSIAVELPGSTGQTIKAGTSTGSPAQQNTYNQLLKYLRQFDDDTYKINSTDVSNGSQILSSTVNGLVDDVNALIDDCICYSDCNAYSVCYCYGNCNHY